MLSDSQLYERALQFAVRIVKAVRIWKKRDIEWLLLRQLVRSGTAIGANIAEAMAAYGKLDFSAKLSIAYKECQETKYWLTVLYRADLISENEQQSLYSNVDELAKMVFASLRTVGAAKAGKSN